MAQSKWVVDAFHSSVNFSVRHMMVSRVRGTFHTFDADIKADVEDLTTASIAFRVDVNSIDTHNEDRENHLKSPDFFDAENYPQMTFQSTDIRKSGNDTYEVVGDLTIRGTTRQVPFRVTFEGVAKDPMSGAEKCGFTADGKINRKDFGLVWNVGLETGGVLVGDEIKIDLEIEAARQPD